MSEPRAMTILHVDDDEANRYAVTRSLKKAGFEVAEAADGSTALQQAAQRPDLIILDVRLPDIDGFEVCRRIKADPHTADIPVLHLSASYITGEAKAEGLDSGADAYLVRPVEPVELIATVNALLRNKATEAALRQSEAKYRGILAALHEAVVLFDGNGRIVTGNASAERILGWPLDVIRNLDSQDPRWQTLAEDESPLPPERHPSQVVLHTGRPITNFVMSVKRPDGASVWMSVNAVPLTDETTGKVTGVVESFFDITDHRRVEHEREQLLASEQAARTEAERAGRMKDEFLATLSHELRTPLNAILGWTQIIAGGQNDPGDVAEGMAVIERNARAQSQIIEDLLDMSRIISGKVRLDVQQVDLSAVVETAVVTARVAADAKGVRLRAVIDPVHRMVTGDAGRLQQVLWNLLSNAMKFTPRGGRVLVTVERVNSHVEVSVKDSGEGIAVEFLPYVFDRFRQADASTTRRHGGLGLGLSIVKNLVELHGGSIHVTSEGKGHGATFTIKLPLAAVQPRSEPGGDRRHPQATSPSASVIPSREMCPQIVGLRILVVDDEADARTVVRRLLEACDAEVTDTGSVDEAVGLVASGTFDVLVSDIGMPEQDGYTLIRRVRALGRAAGGDIPAVALTAYARVEDRVKAIAAGFVMHVAKPVEPVELITMVAGAAGRTGR